MRLRRRSTMVYGIMILVFLFLFVGGIYAQETETAEQLVKKAYAEAMNGNYDRAIEILTQAIKIDPKNEEAYYQRGMAYGAKELNDQAIADFTEALRLNPQDTLCYIDRSVYYIGKGLYDNAIADCTQALKLEPNNAVAYTNRALAYHYKGMQEEAE